VRERLGRILIGLGAAAVAVGLVLFVGWTVYRNVLGGRSWVDTRSSGGASAPEKPLVRRSLNKLQPVYVPLAYVPRAYASEDRIMSDLRYVDDDSRMVWEKIEAKRQRGEARYVMSMAADPRGWIWVGCEDSGVWRYDPSREGAAAWKQFTADDGLGDDNAYAVAVDLQGRVWAGHLNHGVSVYNGAKWQNYEVVGGLSNPNSLSGPLGERVFAIAVCPTDGDVWIASSCGLARYSAAKDAWSYYTRAEGLPSDQASAIAFDAEGNIFVGTQCDGIAMADAKDQYKSWRVVGGPDRMPTDPLGEGLPTSLINDVLVAHDGTVYAATTTGLAWSQDKGRSWRYVRGKDWAEKVRGLYGGPPQSWSERPGGYLAEDYVTCLAEDEKGLIWIGHRQKGCELIDPAAGKALKRLAEWKFVSRLVPTAGGPMIGSYGDGQELPKPLKPIAASSEAAVPPLPAGAKPPTEEELRSLTSRVRALAAGSGPDAAYLGEDWMTQGDWVGRYGRHFALLCSMNAPQTDHEISRGIPFYRVRGSLGPNCMRGDRLRHWVHWVRTDDPRSLYSPIIGIRRQAEWDDHGEAYPITHEGPDIWATIEVPEGVHRISLYFFNKDGHSGVNRLREHLVELCGNSPKPPGVEPGRVLAHSRVEGFLGGVYKQFVVRGPATYRVKVAKNYSFNAICSAFLIDRLAGPPTQVDGMTLAWMGDIRYDPPPINRPAGVPLHPSEALWVQLDESRSQPGTSPLQRTGRVLAYRGLMSAGVGQTSLPRWRWELCLWDAQQRQEFWRTMQRGWTRMQEFNPHLRSRQLNPYSPGVRD